MNLLKLTFGCGPSDRVAAIFDGRVRIEGCELASSGLPSGLELEILETMRDKVPPEVFTTVYTNPVNGTPENVRNNLREALRLLREAGYEVRDRRDPAFGDPPAGGPDPRQ